MKRARFVEIMPLALVLALVLSGCPDPDPIIEYSETIVPGKNLAEKLDWLLEQNEEGFYVNLKNNGCYIVEVSSNATLAPQDFYFGGLAVTIRLVCSNWGGVITLSEAGQPLLTVKEGVTLILDSGVTLRGLAPNNNAILSVEGGRVEMMKFSQIRGNNSFMGSGGGVYINTGTFVMHGGEISNNTARYGAGVFVSSGGTFEMRGGAISRNQASPGSANGGGVLVNGGTFQMSGGAIWGNDAPDDLKNTATGTGSALRGQNQGWTAQFGIFEADGTFTSKGDLEEEDNEKTISVTNGQLETNQ